MYSQDNSNKASRALANEALIRLDDFTAWIEECPKQRAHARLKVTYWRWKMGYMLCGEVLDGWNWLLSIHEVLCFHSIEEWNP